MSFINIDSDIYSSAKTIFTHLKHAIGPGTIIHFDEYFNYPGGRDHEYKAFQEFLSETGLRAEFLCYNRYHQQAVARIVD